MKACRIRLFLMLSIFLLPSWSPSIQAQTLPEEASVCCINGFHQTYQLSCEARAAVDWAAFFGYTISEYDFLAALPSSDNPDVGFVGAWDGVWGNIPPDAYGVHPPPVAQTLMDLGVPAQAHDDLSWDDLCREIAAGRPVIVWVIAQMWDGHPILYESENGQSAIVAHYEHTMILTGYRATTIEVVDALTGENKVFELDAFLKSWDVLGNRAILAGNPPASPTVTATHLLTVSPSPTLTLTPSPSPIPIGSVTVKTGDTLLGIAAVRHTPWDALTTHNGLTYPYFIYPGDVLLLP